MADIASWSPIDDNNNAAPPHGWPEGQMPSTANNCARAMMGGVRRWYDTVTAQLASLTTSLGNYLPLGGGHLTGPVTSASSFAASGNLSGWDISAGNNVFTQYVSASATVTAAQLTSTVNINAAGSVTGGYIHSTGNVQADNAVTTPYVHAGAAGILSDGNIGTPGTITALDLVATRNIGANSGAVTGLDLIALRNIGANSGTVTAINLTATSNVTGGYIHSTGNVQADNAFTGGAVSVSGALNGSDCGTTGYYYNKGIAILRSGGGPNTSYTYLYDNSGTETIAAGGANDRRNFYRQSNHWFTDYLGSGAAAFAIFNLSGTYNVNGSWGTISDAVTKENIVPYDRGLAAIMVLNPVSYNYKPDTPFADPDRTVRYGLVAQDVAPHIPEMVGETVMRQGDADSTMATLLPSHLVFVLVNAVKELNARLITLEHRGDAA